MREIDAQQLKDIARGAGILGTGGGGDPYLGALVALRTFEEFGPPTVLDPDELDDDALVALPVMVGAPVPLIEKLSFGPELVTVFHALNDAVGRKITGLMSPEMGGVNSIVPLILSSRLGLPVVDADGMGRAYPQIDLTTFTLYDIAAAPFALADEHGNSVIINGVTNRWVERLARAAVVEFGAICPGMGFPVSGVRLKEGAVLRTLTYAEHIGRAIREAHDTKTDAVEEILRVTRGYELFRGKITDVQRRTEHGWSIGEAVVSGMDRFTDESMTVSFQNENLVAWRDGRTVASVPDLITILDAESGEAITTERLRYGFRVVVLGIPCDEKWRTPAGVALGGPRHFHYEMDYVPIEELNSAVTVG